MCAACSSPDSLSELPLPPKHKQAETGQVQSGLTATGASTNPLLNPLPLQRGVKLSSEQEREGRQQTGPRAVEVCVGALCHGALSPASRPNSSNGTRICVTLLTALRCGGCVPEVCCCPSSCRSSGVTTMGLSGALRRRTWARAGPCLPSRPSAPPSWRAYPLWIVGEAEAAEIAAGGSR